MIRFVFPEEKNERDVLAFYAAFKAAGEDCIGCKNGDNYPVWLEEMQNRRAGKNLPAGYVRENFYLCYLGDTLAGVFSLKFDLTPYLFSYGGHVGYAVAPAFRNRGCATEILKQGTVLAKELGFEKLLLVCDEDNVASEKVILKNGGVFENKLFDEEENVFVKRFWIDLR